MGAIFSRHRCDVYSRSGSAQPRPTPQGGRPTGEVWAAGIGDTVQLSHRRRMSVDERSAARIIEDWPDDSKEPAQLVIDAYGEPAEATDSMLVWHEPGQWKRIVATKVFFEHRFPAPHIDAVESFIDYRVPTEYFSPLAEFDGSIVVERTAGEVSARCHDEQANLLALNLMHDIVTGAKDVKAAREYYAKEFLDARREQPTPYMAKLHFSPGGGTADPDERALTEEQLKEAVEAGKGQHA
jgi:hypothetical protein